MIFRGPARVMYFYRIAHKIGDEVLDGILTPAKSQARRRPFPSLPGSPKIRRLVQPTP